MYSKSNRTILIDDNDNRVICDDYKQLIIGGLNSDVSITILTI